MNEKIFNKDWNLHYFKFIQKNKLNYWKVVPFIQLDEKLINLFRKQENKTNVYTFDCFLGVNKNVTEEFINDHLEYQWSIYYLLYNKNISMPFILEHYEQFMIFPDDYRVALQTIPWPQCQHISTMTQIFIPHIVGECLSIYCNIEDMEKYPNIPWNSVKVINSTAERNNFWMSTINMLYGIGYNSYLVKDIYLDTVKIIEKEKKKFTKKWNAILTIQRYWMEAYYNPEYKVCQKRLMRDYEKFHEYILNIRKNDK